jgi:hypothetical protein
MNEQDKDKIILERFNGDYRAYWKHQNRINKFKMAISIGTFLLALLSVLLLLLPLLRKSCN